MRFLVRSLPDGRYECLDPDHPDGPEVIGTGMSPDECLGDAVRNEWLGDASGSISVDDIINAEDRENDAGTIG